jgi:phosphoglycerate dehydrogenase-like enzyme
MASPRLKTHKILFTGCTLSGVEIKDLKKKGFLIIPDRLDLTEAELIKALKEVDGYILGGEEIATKKVIESTSNLKIVAFYGVGYEKYVDTLTATQKGIVVTNTPKANSYTTAEHTVALILDITKQITNLSNRTKKGEWGKRQAWNLQGKTLGIIGLGAVGSNVARILRNGFGMEALFVDIVPKLELEVELKAKRVDLPTLLSRADIVSIHVPYYKETVGMIGSKELDLMKPSAFLINTARAEIIDGQALYNALVKSRIAGAACDVYYIEPVPLPEKDPYGLMGLPDNKFILTPHTAYNSKETVEAMNRMVFESIFDFFKGKRPRHLVNPDYKKM